jgi:NAD(P)-dependent dehydrogenase (short-subunit alcohol dehydrogenase family)
LLDLTGRTVVVTGASSGIGLAAAEQLARLGAELVLVGRDPARLDAAAARVRAARGQALQRLVTPLRCDFQRLAEVRALAGELLARCPRIFALVNGAGGASLRRRVSADGHERTLAVNHLAPYLLTRLLLDRLRASAPSRIVNVASVGHHRGDLDFADLQLERGYEMMRAYGRSKLCNILFTRELGRRLAGTGVTANCLHPGLVATRIWDRAPWILRPAFAVAKWFMISPERAAESVVRLVADPALEGVSGRYFDQQALAEPSALGRDDGLARRLWEESARLVGVEG